MRDLLRDFADRGGTVLLSSHLLREVEAIADRLVVIARGRIVAQGTPQDLLADVPRTAVRAAGGDAADLQLRTASRTRRSPSETAPMGYCWQTPTRTRSAASRCTPG